MRALICMMAVLLAGGTALATGGADGPGCMTGRVLSVRPPLFTLATAHADTVRAGPGTIRYGPGQGDSLPLATIHGQRFRLDRLGGDVPAELSGAEGRDAVLVPYGWECGDTWRWREARWATPGTQVFAVVSLRPRGQWVDGMPTFDVEMVHDVYPGGWAQWADTEAADSLTAAQLFDLQGRLPTIEEAEAAPFPAYRGLLAWARENPVLASHFPATLALAEMHDALQPCVPAYDPHPVAGTYRARVIVEGTDTLAFDFQTDATGSSECGPPPPRLDLRAVEPRTADTVRLYVGSPPGARLADGVEPALRCGGGSVRVLSPPRAGADGHRRWEADFNFVVFRYCGTAHPRLLAATEAVLDGYPAPAEEAGSRDDGLPGSFREGPDGEVRFEQAWRAGGRVVLEVRATRVSPETQARDLR